MGINYGKDGWGGIAPRFGDKVPPGMAQAAKNCRLGARLSSLTESSPYVRLNNNASPPVLLSELTTDEVVLIPKLSPIPNATDVARTHMCLPTTAPWLKIYAYTVLSYLGEAGAPVVTPCVLTGGSAWSESSGAFTAPLALTIGSIEYTPNGMVIHSTLPAGPDYGDLNTAYDYTLTGPIFVFELYNDASSGNVQGGPLGMPTSPIRMPNIALTLAGATQLALAGTIPNIGSIPLFYGGIQYGSFQVVSYFSPDWATRTGVGTNYINCPGGALSFEINLNYTTSYVSRFYAVSNYDVTTRREGPLSDPSALITTAPGELVTITVPAGATGFTTRRLYQSARSETGYELIAELASGTNTRIVTPFEPGMGEVNPPAGNYAGKATAATTDPTLAVWLPGSVKNPAGWSSFIYNSGSSTTAKHQIWVSDIDRPYAQPLKNVIDFYPGVDASAKEEKILAQALAGNATIVFTNKVITDATDATGHVIALSGEDPEHLNQRILSSTAPLMSLAGLCKIKDTLYWVTYEGLAACAGGEVEIVTRDFYTTTEWAALTPSTLKTVVAGNTIYIYPPSGDGIWFTQGEGQRSMGNYTPDANGKVTASQPINYTTGALVFDRPTMLDYVRIVGTGTSASNALTLNLYLDGVTSPTKAYTVTTAELGTFKSLADSANVPAKKFVFNFTGLDAAAILSEVEFYERRVIDIADGAHLTGESVEVWEDIHLKAPAPTRFVAGVISFTAALSGSPATATATITLKDRAGATISPTALSKSVAALASGSTFFTLPRTAAANPKMDYWRAGATVTGGTIESLDLLTNRIRVVDKEFRVTYDGSGIPEWLYTSYKLPGPSWIKSVRVTHSKLSGGSPTTLTAMNIYPNGAETTTAQSTVATDTETLLGSNVATALAKTNLVDVDFGGEDSYVTSFVIHYQTIQDFSNGIDLTDPDSTLGLLYSFPDGRGRPACGSIAASGTTTLSLIADGVTQDFDPVTAGTQLLTVTAPSSGVAGTRAFYLPRTLPAGQVWEMSVTPGTGVRVYRIRIMPEIRVSVPSGVLPLMARDGDFAPWDYSIYDFTESEPVCMVVKTRSGTYSGLYLQLFVDAAITTATPSVTAISVTSGNAINLTAVAKHGSLAFRFVDSNGANLSHLVSDVSLYARQIEAADLGVHRVMPIPSLPPLPAIEYKFNRETDLSGVILLTRDNDYTDTGYTTGINLNLRINGASSPLTAIKLAAAKEYALTGAEACQSVNADLVDDAGTGSLSHLARELFLMPRQVLDVPAYGITIPGNQRRSMRNMTLNFVDPGTFGVVRLEGADYPATLILTPQVGSPFTSTSQTISSALDIKLSLGVAKRWTVDLDVAGPFDALHLIGRVARKFKGKVVTVRHETDPFSWLGNLIESQSPVSWSAARVLASSYPAGLTLTLTLDGTAQSAITITSGEPFRLPKMRSAKLTETDLAVPAGVTIYGLELAPAMTYLR